MNLGIKNSTLVALLAVLGTNSIAFSRSGGSDGGGGSSYALPNRTHTILADLLPVAEQIADEPGVALKTTRALDVLGVDNLKTIHPELIAAAEQQIQRIQPASLSRAASEVFLKSPVLFTSYSFDMVSADHTNGILVAAADRVGIVVSKPRFEALDKTSQVALLVHEALRRVQFQDRSKLDNITLEAATRNAIFSATTRQQDEASTEFFEQWNKWYTSSASFADVFKQIRLNASELATLDTPTSPTLESKVQAYELLVNLNSKLIKLELRCNENNNCSQDLQQILKTGIELTSNMALQVRSQLRLSFVQQTAGTAQELRGTIFNVGEEVLSELMTKLNSETKLTRDEQNVVTAIQAELQKLKSNGVLQ